MFGRTRHTETVLVADIDTASIGLSLVRLGEPVHVVYFLREDLKPEERTPEHAERAVIQLLDSLLAKVLAVHVEKKEAPIAAIYAVVRAPFTQFRTSRIVESYPSTIRVTEAEITRLGQKALSTSATGSSPNRLESGIVHVYVNGYPIAHPEGAEATQLSVIAYESEMPESIRRALTETFGKALPGRTLEMRSSMSALLSVAGEQFPALDRVVLIDVGSTATHCAVVLNEAVTQAIVVNEGILTIITRLASGMLPEETLTQLRMLAHDACASQTCKALKDSLARIEPELAKVFGEAFTTLSSHRRLPNTALISAPAEITPWLSTFFTRIDFSQFTATLQPLSALPLTVEHLQGLVTMDAPNPDARLAVAAAYVHILTRTRK